MPLHEPIVSKGDIMLVPYKKNFSECSGNTLQYLLNCPSPLLESCMIRVSREIRIQGLLWTGLSFVTFDLILVICFLVDHTWLRIGVTCVGILTQVLLN